MCFPLLTPYSSHQTHFTSEESHNEKTHTLLLTHKNCTEVTRNTGTVIRHVLPVGGPVADPC